MSDDWTAAVSAARLVDDQDELRTLFQQAVNEAGAEEASRAWLAVMSGLDSSAAT